MGSEVKSAIMQEVQDFILKLCTQKLHFGGSLEIDGIICISAGESIPEIVIKMHRTVVKPISNERRLGYKYPHYYGDISTPEATNWSQEDQDFQPANQRSLGTHKWPITGITRQRKSRPSSIRKHYNPVGTITKPDTNLSEEDQSHVTVELTEREPVEYQAVPVQSEEHATTVSEQIPNEHDTEEQDPMEQTSRIKQEDAEERETMVHDDGPAMKYVKVEQPSVVSDEETEQSNNTAVFPSQCMVEETSPAEGASNRLSQLDGDAFYVHQSWEDTVQLDPDTDTSVIDYTIQPAVKSDKNNVADKAANPIETQSKPLFSHFKLSNFKSPGKLKQFKCSICSKSFTTRSHKYRHESEIHLEPDKKFATCDVCGKKIHKRALPLHKANKHDSDKI